MMKKIRSALTALLMIAAIVFASGCAKQPEKSENPDAPPAKHEVETEVKGDTETANAVHFKTGTWTSSFGVNYVFYEDGKSGRNVTVADGMGIGFTYELDEDGNCVFHMGSADDVTPASVEFFDGGDDTAAITWEDGSRMVLMFVDADTSDEFADHYTFTIDPVE